MKVDQAKKRLAFEEKFVMEQCVEVFDVISPDQSAVVVFTNGSKFEFDGKGNGETGNWIVDTTRLKQIDKIVIYLRRLNESGGRVFIGDYTGFVPSEQTGRLIISFSKLEEVCHTKSNWNKFANTGPSPVRYIN